MLFVASWRDPQRELTYSCEFSQEGLGIELPGVGKLDRGGGVLAACAAMFSGAERAATFISFILYRVATGENACDFI